MVHKKSTYRLMYKNYSLDVRKSVWRENNSIRERRREEEMSHHSIDESDSDCECDESDEDDSGPGLHQPRPLPHTRPKSILTNSDEQINRHSLTKTSQPPPHIPKLQFSPEQSPRGEHFGTLEDTSENTEDLREVRLTRLDGLSESNPDLNKSRETDDAHETRPEFKSWKRGQVGVMRPGSRTTEYDLIPAVQEECSGPPKRATSAKVRILKSSKYPLTSQLSRTTRRNYQQRDQVNYVPFGTGSSVRHIGDKTSYNVHLHHDQVKKTALQASSLRNREIEDLIRKQRSLSLSDWREKGLNRQHQQHINHTSLWDDGRPVLPSKPRVRQRLRSAPSRVEVVHNYCKHCGGRK